MRRNARHFRTVCLYGFLGVLAIALFAPVSSAGAQPALVSGRVADVEDDPIRGAHVFLEEGLDGPVRRATTDVDGAFVFDAVVPGTVGVFAKAPGYAFDGRSLKLAVGDRVEDVVIRLGEPGVISGTVRDEDGTPVRDARITRAVLLHADPVGIPFAKLTPDGVVEARSDRGGAFDLASLPEGTPVALKVAHPEYAQAGVDGVTVGDRDVRVVLREGVLITGTVQQRETDRPVAQTPVFFTNADPPHATVITRSLGDGSYAVRLNPGSWFVRAAGPTYRTTELRGFDIREGAGRQVLNIDVAPTGRVDGTVKDAKSGDPIEGARVALETRGTLSDLARTGPDGEYAFDATEGEVVVRLTSVPGYLHPPEPALRVIVDAGKRISLPTFWAAPIPPYSIEVVDDRNEPVASAVVSLMRPRQFGWRTTRADGLAELSVASLPADGTVVGSAYHPDGESGAVFAIPRERSEDAIVKLLPLVTLSGRVVDPRDRNVEGAVVEGRAVLPGLTEPVPLWQTVSDGMGLYTWPALVPSVPQVITVSDAAGTQLLGQSEMVLPDAVGTASIRPIVVDAQSEGQSLRGDRLDWWKGDVVCGSIPGRGERSERVKVIVVAPESNVPIMAEGLRQMLRAIDDPRLTAAILTEGTPECGAVDVPVIRGATGGTATVFVLDRDDRVVLETFDLPPAPFLVRQLGEPGV